MHILRSVLKTQFSWIHVLIGLYLVVGLFNLDRLPIAWNDEIQNLDPALVWHHTGHFLFAIVAQSRCRKNISQLSAAH